MSPANAFTTAIGQARNSATRPPAPPRRLESTHRQEDRAMSDRLTLDALNQADRAAFVAALDGIFEHAPWVAGAAFDSRPFATVSALHQSMMQAVLARPTEDQLAFVRLHPDLAGKAARSGEMAPASIAEQAGLGLDQLSYAEYARFERLNGAYAERFHFPFVVCVRRLTRDAVLDTFERRLG